MNECDYCKDPKEVKRKQKKSLKKYGWYSHYIKDDSDCPYDVNYHTHGVKNNFDHPDFQIVFPIDVQISHNILFDIIDRVKKGKKFKVGVSYKGILTNNYKLKFIKAQESERDVLRLIFPDEAGNLDLVDMEESYQRQYG